MIRRLFTILSAILLPLIAMVPGCVSGSLEQVYGAITHYLAHRDEIVAYLRRQDAEWAQWRSVAEQRRGAVVDRLRSLKPLGAEPTP
jgi:hypothetical protein